MRKPAPSLVWVFGALSVASVLLSSFVLRRGGVDGVARIAVALAPVPFFIGFLIAEVQWIRACDEFQRRVILESLAIAFPSSIVLAVIVESIQKAGFLTSTTVGDIWPWMALCWVPSLAWALHRYR
jgi:hypothetical protein